MKLLLIEVTPPMNKFLHEKGLYRLSVSEISLSMMNLASANFDPDISGTDKYIFDGILRMP